MELESADQLVRSFKYETDAQTCPVECVQNLIRMRAYEHFEKRGRASGQELEDWTLAERELKDRLDK